MGTDGVLCFHCSKYFKTGKPAQAKSIDPVFVTTGFKNWKKALEKCSMHEKSEGHKVAVTTVAYENRPVTTQLSSAVSTQQAENRASLLKIIGGEMFWQGRDWPLGGMNIIKVTLTSFKIQSQR